MAGPCYRESNRGSKLMAGPCYRESNRGSKLMAGTNVTLGVCVTAQGVLLIEVSVSEG